MEINKLDEMARKATEQMQRSVDNSPLATIKRHLDGSPLAQIQRALENSSTARFQKYLDDPRLAAFHEQAEQAAAKIRAVFDNSAAIRAFDERTRAFELIAEQAAEKLRVFDSITEQAAERFRAAYDNSAVTQALAKVESSLALTAAQRYLDEHAAQWERLRNSLVHEPVRYTIKAKIPKIRISAQAQLDFSPAPAAEPKIEMPPVHWLASALDYLLTKGAFKRTVEPILVDIRDEYYELIKDGEEGRAKWIVARGCWLVIWGQLARPLTAISGWLANLRG